MLCRGQDFASVETRVLIFNHEPVFEDRLLTQFDAFDQIETLVVRTVGDAVQLLISENFDGFIVEGEPELAVEAATIGRQHFPSLKIACAPWQPLNAELLSTTEQQHLGVITTGTGEKRLRSEVRDFLSTLQTHSTVSAEGIDPCHSLVGNLNQFSAAEILQMACLSQRSGRFTFKSGRGKAEIYLYHGTVRHAVFGDLEGEEAVAEVFRWRQGRFFFEEGIISHLQTVDRPWAHLLIDNLQKLDETMDLAGAGAR